MKNTNKKWFLTILGCAVIALTIAACGNGNGGDVPATGITLNKTTLTLVTGGSETLTATPAPSDTTDKVEWSTSAASIATVDKDGKVTAAGFGKATITAKAGTHTATCEVFANGFSYGSDLFPIHYAAFSTDHDADPKPNVPEDDKGFSFRFSNTKKEADINEDTLLNMIDIPKELMGTNIDLSDDTREYEGWNWYIEFYDNQGKRLTNYEGQEDATGALRADRTGTSSNFTITLETVLFGWDDQADEEFEVPFKLFYSGSFEHLTGEEIWDADDWYDVWRND
jgi:hypothetical protein